MHTFTTTQLKELASKSGLHARLTIPACMDNEIRLLRIKGDFTVEKERNPNETCQGTTFLIVGNELRGFEDIVSSRLDETYVHDLDRTRKVKPDDMITCTVEAVQELVGERSWREIEAARSSGSREPAAKTP